MPSSNMDTWGWAPTGMCTSWLLAWLANVSNTHNYKSLINWVCSRWTEWHKKKTLKTFLGQIAVFSLSGSQRENKTYKAHLPALMSSALTIWLLPLAYLSCWKLLMLPKAKPQCCSRAWGVGAICPLVECAVLGNFPQQEPAGMSLPPCTGICNKEGLGLRGQCRVALSEPYIVFAPACSHREVQRWSWAVKGNPKVKRSLQFHPCHHYVDTERGIS